MSTGLGLRKPIISSELELRDGHSPESGVRSKFVTLGRRRLAAATLHSYPRSFQADCIFVEVAMAQNLPSEPQL